jgi:uncharacterized protein YndB with AHSA1/START domain
MTIPSTADRILWRLHLKSSPQQVYDLLSTDNGRRSFWAESAVETNGVIRFHEKGQTWESRIVERDAPRRFVIEYGGLVAFDLADDGQGGTDLTLTHTGFESASRDDALPGWLNILFPLKATADFAIDLRNHDPTRNWSDGYVDH